MHLNPYLESLSSHYQLGVARESTLNAEIVEAGKVWINDLQYFDNVPLVTWEFYIGSYQPASQKDRKLSFDDLLHYQKNYRIFERNILDYARD